MINFLKFIGDNLIQFIVSAFKVTLSAMIYFNKKKIIKNQKAIEENQKAINKINKKITALKERNKPKP